MIGCSIWFPGPISSILVNKFGSRPIIILGGCLAGLGLVIASFCNTVEQLYLFIGVVGGESEMSQNCFFLLVKLH